MNNKEKERKENRKIYIQAVSGLVVLGLLVYGVVWILGGGLANRKSVDDNIPVHDTNTAPAVVQHFLYTAGNVGSTQNTSFSAITNLPNTFKQNLANAYKNSVTDFASISPYTINSTLTYQTLATQGRGTTPQGIYVLNKNSIAMSSVHKEANITKDDKYNSSHTEQAVSIDVNFANTFYSFNQTANDPSWDGSYNVGVRKSSFNNIKFTLVYEGGRWKIYSISNLDDIGDNLATYDSSFQNGNSNKFVTNATTTKVKKGGNLNEIFQE